MLILTPTGAVNTNQVFYFSVSVPIPAFLHIKGAKPYMLRAHHSGLSDNEGNSDCVVVNSYTNETAAYADLDRIIAAYQNGAVSVDLR